MHITRAMQSEARILYQFSRFKRSAVEPACSQPVTTKKGASDGYTAVGRERHTTTRAVGHVVKNLFDAETGKHARANLSRRTCIGPNRRKQRSARTKAPPANLLRRTYVHRSKPSRATLCSNQAPPTRVPSRCSRSHPPPLTLVTASRAAGLVTRTMRVSRSRANAPSSGIEESARDRLFFLAADSSDARRRRFRPGTVWYLQRQQR